MKEARNISFRGDEKYRKLLHQAALDRGLKVQALIEIALANFLSNEAFAKSVIPAETKKIAFRPGPTAEGHRLLDEIFSDGTPKDADWILGNLKNFVEAIRSRKPAKRQKTGTGPL